MYSKLVCSAQSPADVQSKQTRHDWLAPPFIEGSQQIEICLLTFCPCPILSMEKFVFYFYTLAKMEKVSPLKLLQKQTPASELCKQLMFFHSFWGKKLWHDANQILSQVFFPKKLLNIKCALKYSLCPKLK